jgi:8-oxo-dGTP diphosphatase
LCFPDQYVASLARKRMAAGALFRDEAGEGLLVNPVYKPTWDLPGGAVEAEESPMQPVVARSPRNWAWIAPAETGMIVLAYGEITEFAFVAADEVPTLVTPLLARRIAACLGAVESGTVATLENGSPPA